MQYLEIRFKPIVDDDEKSVLIGELLLSGFDSFSEEENSLLAYITEESFDEKALKASGFFIKHPEIKFEINHLENKNWNQEWESNYQPVTIAGKCHVRAPFHPSLKNIAYEIVIEPKMSFGTAHHETTRQMAEFLMTLDVTGLDVLDMGCGTGVLAILANKMGAASVIGIDNDEWAWRNARENFEANGIHEENVFLGDASDLKENKFDLVLANINRNVLLQDIKLYYKTLKKSGRLLLSGFYGKDIEAIVDEAVASGFVFDKSGLLNDWAVVLLKK